MSKSAIFQTIFHYFSSNLQNWVAKTFIFITAPFFESRKMESNEPSVKMTHFPTIFHIFLSKLPKWVAKTFIFILPPFFESREEESNEPTVKITIFPTISAVFRWKWVPKNGSLQLGSFLRISMNAIEQTRSENTIALKAIIGARQLARYVPITHLWPSSQPPQRETPPNKTIFLTGSQQPFSLEIDPKKQPIRCNHSKLNFPIFLGKNKNLIKNVFSSKWVKLTLKHNYNPIKQSIKIYNN